MKTEQEIEESLITKLQELKYTFRDDICDKESLENNFRFHFEQLNQVRLTDKEFEQLKIQIVSPDVFETSKRLREKHTFIREDGTPLYYTLVNIKHWCKNEFEVINQLRINTYNSHHRYDVIILINGLPVVQIELKSLGTNTKRAMEQIVGYKNDVGNGYNNSLLCFMQLFIVSNKRKTFYFANNNTEHLPFNAKERFLPVYIYANGQNKKIEHLHDFAKGFLAKCTLGQLISRYMVLIATEKKVMIMRPYQVYAVKSIVDCIEQNRGNGYIWHTTGSGKTLTSFKVSTLLKDNSDIDKCLFVVDRKDLDRQTREEFNKFQKDCVEENTNTYTLVQRLLSDNIKDKVIVTTIQKLGLALDENSKRNKQRKSKGKQTYKEILAPLRDKRMVFIFDECHRSQFGDNHRAIKEFFPNSQLFGFTGTPIFYENAVSYKREGQEKSKLTTDDVFKKCLHSYTIGDAIEDENVLRFHIDYYKPEEKENIEPPKKAVVKSILDKHAQATNYRSFNALFATSSIDDAISYYEEFQKQLAERKEKELENAPNFNIACVFSPPASLIQDPTKKKDVEQLQDDLEQEKKDNSVEPNKKLQALTQIIDDYNKQYKTNCSVSDFDEYYKDVQMRIKNHQYIEYDRSNKIDITIVVDMLLTGFDSKYLNTLYVDKKLKYHGLIQAFSRTNRVLNDNKPYGNILDFKNNVDKINEAIGLFSNKEKNEQKEIWLVDSAPKVIEQLAKEVENLQDFMQSQGVEYSPRQISNLKGDEAKATFINQFKEVQKLTTQLDQYTDLEDNEKQDVEKIISPDVLQEFRGAYLDIAQELRAKQDTKGGELNPFVDEVDFELVLFASVIIDYDYIKILLARSTKYDKPQKQKMEREKAIGLIKSNANLLEEREDMIEYIKSLPLNQPFSEDEIDKGYKDFRIKKRSKKFDDVAKKHNLPSQAIESFVNTIVEGGVFDEDLLSELVVPLDLGWRERSKKELVIMADLLPIFKQLAGGKEIRGISIYEEK